MDRKNSHPAFRAVHELFEAQVLETPEHAYWKGMYQSSFPTLDLPYDFPLPATRTFARETLRFELSGDTVAAIRQFSRQGNAAP
ncbi:hypothetical protein RZS08_50340, partial [Arthrospira platensis SPKY1]|nr:hypothetical protein [Arthrospira platensis SPKY1]